MEIATSLELTCHCEDTQWPKQSPLQDDQGIDAQLHFLSVRHRFVTLQTGTSEGKIIPI